MVSDSTVSIDSTQSRTWILTFSVDTCCLWWTIWVNYAFRSTIGRRANHLWKTRTMTSVSNGSWWVAVCSTWVWITWIFIFHWFYDNWRLSTCSKWISNISLYTNTVWYVIDYLALGIYSTSSTWTWVHTMQVLTCFSWWTFCIGCTFWSTGNIWVSKVIRYTLTCSCSSSILANSITSTRWGIAGINSLSNWNC